jgi:hypothetical protein
MNDPELPLRLAKYHKDATVLWREHYKRLDGLKEAHGLLDYDFVVAGVLAGMKWGDVIETDEGSLECVPSGSVRRGEPEMFFGKKFKYIKKEGE